jgi:hypothetical protein
VTIDDERIVCALERIAVALETLIQQPKQLAKSTVVHIPDEWLNLARRVVGGEKMTEIAQSICSDPVNVRAKILRAFRKLNPELYSELRQRKDYGCTREQSMRLLVTNAERFGITSDD